MKKDIFLELITGETKAEHKQTKHRKPKHVPVLPEILEDDISTLDAEMMEKYFGTESEINTMNRKLDKILSGIPEAENSHVDCVRMEKIFGSEQTADYKAIAKAAEEESSLTLPEPEARAEAGTNTSNAVA